jgi:hypothetical protein
MENGDNDDELEMNGTESSIDSDSQIWREHRERMKEQLMTNGKCGVSRKKSSTIGNSLDKVS